MRTLVLLPWIAALLLVLFDRTRPRPGGARSPYRAAAASLLLPGLGQLYNGQPVKALLLWAGPWVVFAIAGVARLLYSFSGMLLAVAVLLGLWALALWDATRTAMRLQTYTPRAFNRWYIYIVVVLVAMLVSVLLGPTAGVRAFRVPGGSMEPSLRVGDCVVARLEDPGSYVPRRGDIIVFEYPNPDPRAPKANYVKRCIGTPGDIVELRNNALYVNGERIEEEYIKLKPPTPRWSSFGPVKVPEGQLLMLGDNRNWSADSREWGFLPQQSIVGVVEYVYFSWDSAAKSVRWSRIGTTMEEKLVAQQAT